VRKSRIQLLAASGCVCAAIASIPTIAAGAAGSPTVSSAPATNVNSSGATLNGSVNPNGQQTSYAFDWGTATTYGHETAFTDAGAGTTAQSVKAAISGLSAGTTYHFRAIAKNAAGVTSPGNDESFTTLTPTPSTPAPGAATGAASQISDTAVRVNGAVSPHGQATTYFFQYGTTTAYGVQTRPFDGGSSTSTVAVHSVLGGLTPNTTYHYRLVAQGAGGTTYGTDHTVYVGPGPSRVAFMGHMGFVSPGGIIGVEAGCFGGGTPCQGHVTMSARDGGAVLGERNFYIAPNSGGFQNIGISAAGKQMLKQNGVWHLLQVDVTVTTTAGQRTSQTMTLARWVWR
jgi:hypothetical protein